jgi:hypothetical protein
MARLYGESQWSSDTASKINPKREGEKFYDCPCCGSRSSNGEEAQAKYWSVVDSLFSVLTSGEGRDKFNAATKLIAILNSEIVTGISTNRNGEWVNPEQGSEKVNVINAMVRTLIECRK